MYGPSKGSYVVEVSSNARANVGMPTDAMTAPKDHLSMPSAAPATVGPV